MSRNILAESLEQVYAAQRKVLEAQRDLNSCLEVLRCLVSDRSEDRFSYSSESNILTCLSHKFCPNYTPLTFIKNCNRHTSRSFDTPQPDFSKIKILAEPRNLPTF